MGQLPDNRFGRVLTAMVTPFDDGGRLDLDGAQRLATWLVDHGSDGLVVNGTTGESPTLSAVESVELFAAVRDAVDAPVIAGTGSNDTAHAIRQSEEAAEAGVDGLLVVTPYYNKPSQAGLDRHFRLVAAATDLPIILYDIPGRTSRKVDTDTLVGLAHDVPNIVGLKDAAGDPAETAVLIAEAPDDFEVYSGDDNLTLPLLAVGASGVISVVSHWAGTALRAMFDAFDSGDLAGARRVNQRLLASYTFASSLDAPNPVPTKAMLRTVGLPAGECRPPMGPTPEGLEVDAKELWESLAGEV
jgi:4-hydroxy-tetrahydrodipicolinate synthase